MSLDQIVKTTAVAVDESPAVELPAEPLEDRVSLLIQNLGPDSVYIGGADVTADNGVLIAINQNFSDPAFGPNVSLYAICGTGDTADVRVMELA